MIKPLRIINLNYNKMEEIKTQLIQTGFTLDRLYTDKKIDDDAYTILKNRNNQALALLSVGIF